MIIIYKITITIIPIDLKSIMRWTLTHFYLALVQQYFLHKINGCFMCNYKLMILKMPNSPWWLETLCSSSHKRKKEDWTLLSQENETVYGKVFGSKPGRANFFFILFHTICSFSWWTRTLLWFNKKISQLVSLWLC